MTIDTARLRALAEAALNADDACDRAETEGARSDELQAAINDAEDATQDFRNAATPENVLALLAERDALAADARRYRFIRDADRSGHLDHELRMYAMETLDEYVDAALEDEAALDGAKGTT
jgi:hypothetical protein